MTNVAKAMSATDNTLRPPGARSPGGCQAVRRPARRDPDGFAGARSPGRPGSGAAPPAARRLRAKNAAVCGIVPALRPRRAHRRAPADCETGARGGRARCSARRCSGRTERPERPRAQSRRVRQERDGGRDQPARAPSRAGRAKSPASASSSRQRRPTTCGARRESRRGNRTAPAIPMQRRWRARTSPSAPSNRRTRAGVKPSAQSSPTSRTRCSSPSLKKSTTQQQARDDDEEGEVGEVLAEVGRATRGAERERADGGDGDALRVGRGAAVCRFCCSAAAVCRHPRRASQQIENLSRCRSVSPQFARPLVGEEGLGRRAMVVASRLCRPATGVSRQLQREGGSQSATLSACVMPGILRREPAVGDARNRHDARQREVCLRRAQAGGRVPEAVLERDGIARGVRRARERSIRSATIPSAPGTTRSGAPRSGRSPGGVRPWSDRHLGLTLV